MPVGLLDSNVWVALTIDRHQHHRPALSWFDEVRDDGSACFCRATQLSFLRLVSSQNIFQEDTINNRAAVDVYRQFRADPRVGWLEEPVGLEPLWLRLVSARTPSPKRWMDAYLAVFAKLHHVTLVTFDQGFRQFTPRLELKVLSL